MILIACADQASGLNSANGVSVLTGMDEGLQIKKQGGLCFMVFSVCFVVDLILLVIEYINTRLKNL